MQIMESKFNYLSLLDHEIHFNRHDHQPSNFHDLSNIDKAHQGTVTIEKIISLCNLNSYFHLYSHSPSTDIIK